MSSDRIEIAVISVAYYCEECGATWDMTGTTANPPADVRYCPDCGNTRVRFVDDYNEPHVDAATATGMYDIGDC